MGFKEDLQRQFGLENVQYKANLSKEELFNEAIANDRGRIRPDGPDDEPKAEWELALGDDTSATAADTSTDDSSGSTSGRPSRTERSQDDRPRDRQAKGDQQSKDDPRSLFQLDLSSIDGSGDQRNAVFT